jgi:hypothetical protein
VRPSVLFPLNGAPLPFASPNKDDVKPIDPVAAGNRDEPSVVAVLSDEPSAVVARNSDEPSVVVAGNNDEPSVIGGNSDEPVERGKRDELNNPFTSSECSGPTI